MLQLHFIMKQVRPSSERTYIHTYRYYVDIPRNFMYGSSLAWSLHRRISAVMFKCGGVSRALADSSDFRLLGEQNSPKCEMTCFGLRWTAEQNVTPLALSSAEKSVTVQTHKLQTVNDISTPCLSACVDNKSNCVMSTGSTKAYKQCNKQACLPVTSARRPTNIVGTYNP